MKEVILRKEATQDLAAGALAYSYEFLKDGVLDQLMVNFSAACSQTITITFDSQTHANYDVILKSEVLSSAVDFLYQPTRPIFFQKGDKVVVGITSGGAAVAFMTAFLKEVHTWNA
jgi:c-di-GMP-binding flagellar brake protein YcgR